MCAIIRRPTHRSLSVNYSQNWNPPATRNIRILRSGGHSKRLTTKGLETENERTNADDVKDKRIAHVLWHRNATGLVNPEANSKNIVYIDESPFQMTRRRGRSPKGQRASVIVGEDAGKNHSV